MPRRAASLRTYDQSGSGREAFFGAGSGKSRACSSSSFRVAASGQVSPVSEARLRYSETVVLETLQLRAILRSDRPAAKRSRRISLIFDTGNLRFGMWASFLPMDKGG